MRGRAGIFGTLGSALTALLAALPAAADDCPSFGEAAGRSGEQYQTLLSTRGVANVIRQPIPRDLRGLVGSYLHFPATPAAEGRNGLLFYHRDGEAVCGYLWRSDEIRMDADYRDEVPYRSFRLPVGSPDELSALVEAVRLGLSVGAVTAARAPRLRAEEAERQATRGASALADMPTPRERLAELTGRLSAVLFHGIGDRIEDLENLSIVPALNIGTVPFGALDPDGDGVPLAASVAVNVEASLGDVLEGRIFSMRPEFRPQAIAGDPDATGDPQWIFPRLPGAEAEARTVALRFGAEPVLGGEATIAEVAGRLAGSAYIHIAAHGLSDPQDPIDGSFLALSDGRLTARRIQEMRLSRNPLVVLSACQTGLGGALDAGIIGLARAFMLAGASSVVSSLWNVDDEATAWIMARFLAHLDTRPPAEALRLAQYEARERWPHPSIWSSFVLFGSRSIVLDAAAAQGGFAGAELSLTVRRRRGGAMEPVPGGEALAARSGDEVHATVENRLASPVDVHFIYVGAGGGTFHVSSERLAPGAAADVPLLRFDGDFHGAALLTLVRETDPFTPVDDIARDVDGAPGLLLLRDFVEPAAMPALFPEGIHRLASFGALEADTNVAMPEGGRRGGVFVTSLVAEE